MKDEFKLQRENMVISQLKTREIVDRAVLKVMSKIPRELFVPTELKDFAYEDQPLPIASEQTISQPYIVAFMTQVLQLKPTDKVLEIGTGSGYQSAVLAELVKEVFSIEIEKDLFETAGQRLSSLGYNNIYLKYGNGRFGWSPAAPFDKIILTAAAPAVPPALLEQLRYNGRLVMPLGDNWQDLILVVKDKKGKIDQRNLLPVSFVLLK